MLGYAQLCPLFREKRQKSQSYNKIIGMLSKMAKLGGCTLPDIKMASRGEPSPLYGSVEDTMPFLYLEVFTV
jgi:hypothetical protein